MNSTLSPMTRLYLLALSSFIAPDGTTSVSVEEMHAATGISERTAREIRNTLEELGITTRTARRQATTLTTLSVEALRQYARPGTSAGSWARQDPELLPGQESLRRQKCRVKNPPDGSAEIAHNPHFQAENGDSESNRDFCASRANNSYLSTKTLSINPLPLPNELGGGGAKNADDTEQGIINPNGLESRTKAVAAMLEAETGRSGQSVIGAVRAIVAELQAFPDDFAGGPFDAELMARRAFDVARSLRGPSSGCASVGQVRAAVVGLIRRNRENGEYPAVWARSQPGPGHTPPGDW